MYTDSTQELVLAVLGRDLVVLKLMADKACTLAL